MPSLNLEQLSLTHLKGVSTGLVKKFEQLGIHRVQDLLFHLPLRYEDRTTIQSIRDARVGATVQLEGEIISNNVQYGRRRSLHCVLSDGSGLISLRFFHFSAAQQSSLATGTRIRCYGEVRRGRAGHEIYHPEYKALMKGDVQPVSDNLTPVYPATDGLQQGRLRKIIDQALKLLDAAEDLQDFLPPAIASRFQLQPLTESIRLIHRPPTEAYRSWIEGGHNPGRERLAFEELLAHRLSMRQFKHLNDRQQAPALTPVGSRKQEFLQSLPFELTADQQQAIAEIETDLASPGPMLRLLQGDVGSGKTVVAAVSAVTAISNGFQVALMAPTEILAEQHMLNFTEWLEPLGIRISWLVGKQRAAARKQALHSAATGEADVVIGTHALFQDGVEYKNLGLVIVDEQHRFGVHQRLALRNKGGAAQISPHQLVMTATPIPRTLAMSAYADLDCSMIRSLPPGRTPVNTALIPSDRRDEVVQRIGEACRAGNQAYWVCTLVEESDSLQAQAAEATAQQLSEALPSIKIGLAHGRLKPDQKQMVMRAFKQGEVQLLVATTVIEVGVDVPNASLMIIENPERLGMAQLHQLRGRVGRGSVQSHCILLYQNPLSHTGKQRLAVLRESTDGFYIAEKDLELRGPGQVLGTQQTGLMSFRVADIGRDSSMLDDVKLASEIIMQQHPECVDPLIKRWVGDRIDFVNV